jgi:hypothetical protein
MESAPATDVIYTASAFDSDPTGRKLMARQFAASAIDPTGREAMKRQYSEPRDTGALPHVGERASVCR